MALYIPHSIFHLARLFYVRPETFVPYYVYFDLFGDLDNSVGIAARYGVEGPVIESR